MSISSDYFRLRFRFRVLFFFSADSVADDEEEKELLLGQLDGVAAALDEVLKSISNDADLSDVQMSAYEVNSNIDEIRDIMFGSLDIDFGDEEEYAF